MRAKLHVIKFALLLGLSPLTVSVVEAAPSSVADGRLRHEMSDDLDIWYDLGTRFGNSLAAKDHRYYESNRRWQYLVRELRARQRRSDRASKARIAELEEELRTLSWVTEPKFRKAMFAYRTMILTALRKAGPEELAGWRLIARGDPAAGLELLRANQKLQEEADREAMTAAHEAIDETAREILVDGRRVIAIEALKAVESRRIPVAMAIEDWLKVAETRAENRGDRLLLAYLYTLDGDEPNALKQRQIASTRPDPEDRISSLLDDLFGTPSALVLQMLQMGPVPWTSIAELAGPMRKAFEYRRDLSQEQRESLLRMLALLGDCVATIDVEAVERDDVLPRFTDDGKRCVESVGQASSSASRLAELDRSRRRGDSRHRSVAVEPDPSEFAVGLSELLAGLTAIILQAGLDGEEAGESAAKSGRRWADFTSAMTPLVELCGKSSAGALQGSDRCARIRLHALFARHAQGQEVAPSDTKAAAARILAAIAAQRGAAETVWMQRNEVLAQGSPLYRVAVAQLQVLSPEAAREVADALLSAELDTYPLHHPHITDAILALSSLQWYAEFSASAPLGGRFSNGDVFRSIKRIMAPRPDYPPSCALLVEFAEAIIYADRPLSDEDSGILEEVLTMTGRCGLIPAPPGAAAESARQATFRLLTRQQIALAAVQHSARPDLPSIRRSARLVAFGKVGGGAEQVFTTNDLPSHNVYKILRAAGAAAGKHDEAAAAAAILFRSAQAMAPRGRACEACPGKAWRPDVSEAGVSLAYSLEAAGDIEGAMSTYRTVIQGGPDMGVDWTTAHLRLGWLLFKSGRPEAALPFVQTYVEHGRRGSNAPVVSPAPTTISDPILAREAAELAEARRSVALESFEVGLWLLGHARLATGGVKEALALFAELEARRFAALDKGESDEMLPLRILREGELACSVIEREKSARAGWRCRIRLAQELARRKSRAGIGESLAWFLRSLSADPWALKDRQWVCRTRRRAGDSGSAADVIDALRIRCD
ncbi:MAG TPA: hypothetical protein VF548_00265 [Allosphingosinicella sp.]|jgi:hypothetical protein